MNGFPGLPSTTTKIEMSGFEKLYGMAYQSQWLLAVLIFVLSYVVGLVIYRLKFHPLAKYPGPWLAKVTELYPLYHSIIGDRHITFWRLHKKHGDIVRYGPNQISVNTSTGLKEIYGHKANVKKSDWYSVFPPVEGAYSVWTCIDKAIHARKRRTLAHAFSDTALRDIEHCVTRNVNIFCSQLLSEEARMKGEWGEPKNMSLMANYLTFDILAELSFGKSSFGMLEKPDHRDVVDLIFHNAWRCMICGTLPIIHRLGLDKILFPNLVRDRNEFMNFSKAQALQRTKQGTDTDRKDFFSYLLHAKDPLTGQGFSTPELWAESNLLIIAGSDTPATAIAGVFYSLTHHPRVLQKLEKEIRSTFIHMDEIENYSSGKLTSCTYLRACIDETMRMSPPVTGTVPREVLPGGLVVDGHVIPAGTVIGTGFYSIHHNPAYFSDPFSFYPERWIPGSSPLVTEETVERARSGFFPFSYGPSGCIGYKLAYMELRTVVARTVFLFDMRLTEVSRMGYLGDGVEEERKGEFGLKDRWQAEKDGPEVEFRSRV